MMVTVAAKTKAGAMMRSPTKKIKVCVKALSGLFGSLGPSGVTRLGRFSGFIAGSSWMTASVNKDLIGSIGEGVNIKVIRSGFWILSQIDGCDSVNECIAKYGKGEAHHAVNNDVFRLINVFFVPSTNH
jgi:hypothetical protein